MVYKIEQYIWLSQEQQFQQDLVEFEHEKQVAEMREKSTPEKVSKASFYFILTLSWWSFQHDSLSIIVS